LRVNIFYLLFLFSEDIQRRWASFAVWKLEKAGYYSWPPGKVRV